MALAAIVAVYSTDLYAQVKDYCTRECTEYARSISAMPGLVIGNPDDWHRAFRNGFTEARFCDYIFDTYKKYPLSEIERGIEGSRRAMQDPRNARDASIVNSFQKEIEYRRCYVTSASALPPGSSSTTATRPFQQAAPTQPPTPPQPTQRAAPPPTNPATERAEDNANHCLDVLDPPPGFVDGQIQNTCTFSVNYVYCLVPRDLVFTQQNCRSQGFAKGLLRDSEKQSVDVRGEQYAAFACRAPKRPVDPRFFEKRGIRASCE